MRQFFWPVACALALSGCPDGGGGSATADQGVDATTGNLDAGTDMQVDMIFTGPDMDGPGPDMAVPDTGMPNPDTGMPDPDTGMPDPDTGMPDPDTGMPDPDTGMPDPDMTVPDMAMPDPDMAPRECELGQSRDCPGECAGGQQDCGPDGDWAECVYPAELCNGADDDCDGNTDEDFAELGGACMVGVGACTAAGENICDAAGAGTVCNAVAGMPQAEGCDGVDNDCDAQIDEALMEVCYDGPDGTLGIGVCAQGIRICEAGAFGACVNAVLPADEACDGADNDCDGVLDESMGGAALVEGCYDGPVGTQDVGVCRGGQRACVAGGFGPCEDQALPGVEICDLVDNDCDGAADNTPGGCQCLPGEVSECYTGPEGTAGIGACANGNQLCDEDGRFGACNDENVPEAESCDAVDNDCDGEVDNDVAGAGEDCNDGVGACLRDGMTICDGERGEVVCSAEAGAPADETCNAIDDDCDGTADEGTGLGDACRVGVGACAANGAQICNNAGGVVCDAQAGEGRAEQCNGIDDDCDGSTDEGLGLGDACDIGVGACNREGALRCANNGQVECSVVAGAPAPEACDGLDNDCDNQTDEGNPGGGQDCNTGLDGVCSAGVRICAGGAFNCDQRVFPAAEVCDGLDNDCNGDVDDDNGDGPLQRACYGGPGGTEDVGLCRGGRATCAGGEFGDCIGQITPRPEVCDSADNDCNGDIDDLPAGMCVCEPGQERACYSGDAGTEGVGVCRAGRQTCQANGQGYGGCEGEVLPSAEICDGADNDCNREVDDAAGVGVPCTSGDGECRRDGGLICDARTGDLVCGAVAGEAQPEICDGLDNDCNGTRDDVDGLGDRCTSGDGICQRAGNQVCDLNTRELVCNARPGEPEAEICDGIDNDCDTRTDEDVPGVGRRCTAGEGACRAAGQTICAGREGIQCGAQAGEPTPEVCDLIDNDCDRATDEEAAGVGDVCTVGQGICTRDGVQSCSPDGGIQCEGRAGPPAQELCDGEDNDCDGETDEALNCDVFRSCAHVRQGGNLDDGIYVVDSDGAGGADPQSVWCDQTTDGGGWTLVGSTLNTTLNDQSSAWYADLITLAPARANAGIWDGLRPLSERFDVRFTCRAAVGGADEPFDVDLSFYDTPWYTEFTTGTDAESCFSELNGTQADSPVPARRDNLSDRFRRRSDLYDAGYLEGEDNCADSGDFTVDFDNRGMDGNQSDGTDWGEDDTARKCGASGLAGGQWFVWARERPRVAVVGLSLAVTTVLQDAGILADRLAYNPELAGTLTHENYDTIVIGRYANSWPKMTQDLKEALDIFGRDGGNIVTEWEGASIFMSVYDQTFRYLNGAPQQLGWFGGRIGGGGNRGENTPITQTQPDDPVFDGVPNPIQGGGAAEYFFTLADVGGFDFPITLETETLATFPGDGSAAFPAGDLSAIERGRYCGGHMIFAPFDWQDEPDNNGFGALIPNLVNAANAPPPADLAEACKAPTRSVQMLCGASRRDVRDFGLTSRVVDSCVPNGDVQVMWVTRSGVAQIDGAQARSYLDGGGIIVGEYSTSDELYNSIFLPNPLVEEGPQTGRCRDNVMPPVQFNGSNGLWQDNQFEPIGDQSGCGKDLSAFPDLVRLGGWTADTTQLAYRDRGRGRVWFVEADWQDGTASLNDASKGLMRYMATHAAGGNSVRGAVFSGVRQNQNINQYLQRGFRPCLRTPYNSGDVDLDDVQAACHGDVLMMACREVGSNILNVAAVGSRAEVFQDTGESDDPNPHNGVGWYYSANESWGFAPGGQAINRASCDRNSPDNDDRLCWHTGATVLNSGWRCGSNTNLFSAEWERVVLDRFGDVPIDRVIIIE